VIIQDYLHKDHIAKLFSRIGLVATIMTVVAFVLPLFVVTNTHNYWVNTAKYQEQTDVTHLNEILVYIFSDDGVKTFATTKSLNDLFDGTSADASSLSPSFKVVNHDPNTDGIVDQMEVSVSFQANGARVRNIAIV